MWYWKPLEVWSRTFFERDKVNFSQNITIFKTGAVNKDIKYKRKLIRQPSFSDNLQTIFWDFLMFWTQSKMSYVILTFEKTQKYYFLNTMNYIEGSLMKSSGKISRKH